MRQASEWLFSCFSLRMRLRKQTTLFQKTKLEQQACLNSPKNDELLVRGWLWFVEKLRKPAIQSFPVVRNAQRYTGHRPPLKRRESLRIILPDCPDFLPHLLRRGESPIIEEPLLHLRTLVST